MSASLGLPGFSSSPFEALKGVLSESLPAPLFARKYDILRGVDNLERTPEIRSLMQSQSDGVENLRVLQAHSVDPALKAVIAPLAIETPVDPVQPAKQPDAPLTVEEARAELDRLHAGVVPTAKVDPTVMQSIQGA